MLARWSSRIRLSWLLPFSCLLLFLVVPAHPQTVLSSLPWAPLSLSCAVIVALAAFAFPGRCPDRWLIAICVLTLLLGACRLLLALQAPRYGFEASYYANDRFNGLPESSTTAPVPSYTRLDPELRFGSDEFPLFFFNDQERFNSIGPDRLDRGKNLVWSARWLGYLNLDQASSLLLSLTASGPGELRLDGAPLLKVDADGRATDQRQIQLEPGSHAIEVRYTRKRERSAFLVVTSDLDGASSALGSPRITAEAYPTARLSLDRYATWAARVLDVAFLGLMALSLLYIAAGKVRVDARSGSSTWQLVERPLLALVPLGLFAHAALPRLDRVGKMVFLGGGQDWLSYETFARDIQFNGPLMALGKPLGQGSVIYNQPLYPYYLAALHTLSGEDIWGVTALQVLGLGAGLVMVYWTARKIFGIRAAILSLALLVGILVPFELSWVVRRLLTESLYFWTMPAAILTLVFLVEKPTWRYSALAGLTLGLACLSRGPTLLYLPPAAAICWWTLRRKGVAASTIMKLGAVASFCCLALILLVPLRNGLVAGKPNLTAASGGINLEKFHRPSSNVKLGNLEDDPLQRRLDVDTPTREVIEYLRQDPLGYFSSYLPLAAYTIGFGSALNGLIDEEPVQLHADLVILTGLYLLALLTVPRARSAESMLAHAFIAIHFLTMVVFAPYDYENRLVLPMYLFVTVFAAAALSNAMDIVVQHFGSSHSRRAKRIDYQGSAVDPAL